VVVRVRGWNEKWMVANHKGKGGKAASAFDAVFALSVVVFIIFRGSLGLVFLREMVDKPGMLLVELGVMKLLPLACHSRRHGLLLVR
jgi:hypothetical protein